MIKLNKRTFPSDPLSRILYPHRCPVCDGVLSFSENFAVHPACHAKLFFIREPYCLRCGRPLAEAEAEYCADCRKRSFRFRRNFAVLGYNEAARDSVVRFKYYGRQEYAAFYAEEILKARGEELLTLKADALIPVPIHRSRLRKRGYNQAELLARELSRRLGVPCRSDVLLRFRRTRAQKELGPDARIRNLRHALKVRRGAANGLKTVLLVDDIYTTGSTVEACTRVLLEAGIAEVFCLTLCVGMGEEG